MATDAEAYIAALMKTREGAYTNDPNDPGGETNHGITERVARAYGYTGAMIDLPLTVAGDIIMQQFWVEPQFDAIDRIDERIAAKLLDTGVNKGPQTATKYLQRALNVLNDGATRFPDLNQDGNAGRMTQASLRAFLNQRGVEGRAVLLAMIRAQQSMSYIEIAETKPSQERFEFGWQAGRTLL